MFFIMNSVTICPSSSYKIVYPTYRHIESKRASMEIIDMLHFYLFIYIISLSEVCHDIWFSDFFIKTVNFMQLKIWFLTFQIWNGSYAKLCEWNQLKFTHYKVHCFYLFLSKNWNNPNMLSTYFDTISITNIYCYTAKTMLLIS